MEAYPTKVREQVFEAYEQGAKTKEIAKRFGGPNVQSGRGRDRRCVAFNHSRRL